MVDILIVQKDKIFSYNRFGSPAGEVNVVISAPDIKQIDHDLLDIKDTPCWDVIIVDKNFLGSWTDIRNLKKILPSWRECPQILTI